MTALLLALALLQDSAQTQPAGREFRTALDVPYTSVTSGGSQGKPLEMDIYQPPADTPRPAPAVLIIHGGAWIAGNRKDMTSFAHFAASRGFVAATVQYRLAPLNKWPAMLDDVQTAVRFLRANADKYGLDPNRVAAAGASAGGHLSIFLGSIETRDPEPKEYREHSSKVQAVFNVFGPSDMTRDYAQGPGMDALFMAVIGKPRRDAAEEIKAASPLNFIDKNSAPMYILHGLQDPLVHPNQSRYVEARYKELGLPVVAVFIDGMAHNLPLENAEVRRGFENGIQFLLDHLSKRTILLEAIAR